MAKIEHHEAFPNSFDLTRYQPAESFKAAEWYEQLAVRRYLWELSGKPLEQFISLAAQQIQFLGENPLEAAAELRRYAKLTIQELTPEKLAARPFTHTDLALLLPLIDPINFSGKKAHEPIFLPDFYQHGNHPKDVLIRLDLTRPIAEVLAAIEAQLTGLSAAIDQQPRQLSKPLYERWPRYGLLAYLDLKLWERVTGNHIPRRLLADALAPLGTDEDRIKRTVAPLAESLMNNLSALQHRVMLESQGNF
jgi:hypothetical protein